MIDVEVKKLGHDTGVIKIGTYRGLHFVLGQPVEESLLIVGSVLDVGRGDGQLLVGITRGERKSESLKKKHVFMLTMRNHLQRQREWQSE